MNIEDVIDKIIIVLIEKMEPKKIILFGSRAKGLHRKGSDIDLAIEGGKILNLREMRKLKDSIEKISGLWSVDIVFLENLENNLKDVILNKGVVLYEKK